MTMFVVIIHENQAIWAMFVKRGTAHPGQTLRPFSSMVLGVTDQDQEMVTQEAAMK